MITFAALMFAVLASSNLQRLPTEAFVQEEHMRDRLTRSELANFSEAEKAKILLEHARVGQDLKETFGFAWGGAFTNYDFQAVSTNANATEQSRFALPRPVFGFSEFRPLVVEETLYGVCLRRTIDGLFSEWAREAEQEATRTNLCMRFGLLQEDFLRSTNGVRHAWRFSFEHWNEALVLRISDEELMMALLRAAEERRRAAREVKKEVEMEIEK